MVTSDRRRAAALVAVLVVSGCAGAGATVRSASALPPLLTLDGEAVSLSAVAASHDAVVLAFWSATCPCVRRYQARLEALATRHPPGTTAVFAVASNTDEDLPLLRRAAAERRLAVPLLRDPGGRVASSLGIRSTPTTVVLDRAGNVAFVGWIDNEREPGDPDRIPYVENALDALARGRRDFDARSPVFGCPLTRSLGEPTSDCGCDVASAP